MVNKRFSVGVNSSKSYKEIVDAMQRLLDSNNGIYWVDSPSILIFPDDVSSKSQGSKVGNSSTSDNSERDSISLRQLSYILEISLHGSEEVTRIMGAVRKYSDTKPIS